jgi:excisionase family DNA binding protein
METFVSPEEACRRLGIPRRTLSRRTKDGTVRLFTCDRDRRRRLIPLEDLMRLSMPIDITERKEAARPDAARDANRHSILK